MIVSTCSVDDPQGLHHSVFKDGVQLMYCVLADDENQIAYELDWESIKTDPYHPKYIVHKDGIEIRRNGG